VTKTESAPTVLIVEDEFLIMRIAKLEFEDAGFSVLTADNDVGALALVEGDQPIDLLFTDIRIRGSLDGWTIARRARDYHPKLPVIYASGFSGSELQVVEGAAFFKKPYQLAEVIASARALCEAQRGDAAGV
jgi:CheY-like chemotaxis protein